MRSEGRQGIEGGARGGESRRDFFKRSVRFASGVSAAACVVALLGRRSDARTFVHRPPGALAEDLFLGKCSRCGLCARACPYGSIRLMPPSSGMQFATPAIEARANPCRMCEDLPCVKACPTGALDPGLTDARKARMGVAALIDRGKCHALNGNRCEVCFGACPLRRDALKTVPRSSCNEGGYAYFEPVVNADSCTGCGMCEHACILDNPAIQVLGRERFAREVAS